MRRPKKQPVIESLNVILRLLQSVEYDFGTGCWNWSKRCTDEGYGQIKVDGKVLYSHRVAWAVFRGEIPEGITINHRCLNRRCCNHSHLELMTQSDNTRDALRRRHARNQ